MSGPHCTFNKEKFLKLKIKSKSLIIHLYFFLPYHSVGPLNASLSIDQLGEKKTDPFLEQE